MFQLTITPPPNFPCYHPTSNGFTHTLPVHPPPLGTIKNTELGQKEIPEVFFNFFAIMEHIIPLGVDKCKIVVDGNSAYFYSQDIDLFHTKIRDNDGKVIHSYDKGFENLGRVEEEYYMDNYHFSVVEISGGTSWSNTRLDKNFFWISFFSVVFLHDGRKTQRLLIYVRFTYIRMILLLSSYINFSRNVFVARGLFRC